MMSRTLAHTRRISNHQTERTSTVTNEEMWEKLESLGISSQTLSIITSINGYNRETFEDVLFVHTGYRSFDQLDD